MNLHFTTFCQNSMKAQALRQEAAHQDTINFLRDMIFWLAQQTEHPEERIGTIICKKDGEVEVSPGEHNLGYRLSTETGRVFLIDENGDTRKYCFEISYEFGTWCPILLAEHFTFREEIFL